MTRDLFKTALQKELAKGTVKLNESVKEDLKKKDKPLEEVIAKAKVVANSKPAATKAVVKAKVETTEKEDNNESN